MSDALTYEGLMRAVDLAATQAPRMRLVESIHLTEDVGHWIDMVPVTRQPRSKRLWKKLRQRRRRTASLMTVPRQEAMRLPDGTLVMHPVVAAMFRRELAARCETRISRSIDEAMFGAGLIM